VLYTMSAGAVAPAAGMFEEEGIYLNG